MSVKKIKTRFRAYKLGSPGSSFSYFYENYFILLEARLNETSRPSFEAELKECGRTTIDCLHITSWDSDHCRPNELEVILKDFCPVKIEKPGYEPHSDSGKRSEALIDEYKLTKAKAGKAVNVLRCNPEYIKKLDPAQGYGYKEVCYWPKDIDVANHNNNSSVKLYRSGSFNVLSTGDVECHKIGLRFLGPISKNELDVLILPHHGSANGCVEKRFLKETQPHVAICSSDFDNMFEHPCKELCGLLYKFGVRLFTTKTGDVVIRSIGDHSGNFEVINFRNNSTEVSSRCKFVAKKKRLLSHNQDTIRANIQGRSFKWPKGRS